MLNTPPKSTLNSAVDCPSADKVHCPPAADRSLYNPSTAFSDPQMVEEKGYCCHVGFPKAMFSKNKSNDFEIQKRLLGCVL